MSQDGSSTRISIAANRGVTGALFGLAIITYITHAYIRARLQKQFGAEDALLLFAVICLCGATGLAFSTVQGHYDVVIAIWHVELDRLFDVLDNVPMASKLSNAATTLWWFVIFPVKLAYLFFFRRLILRLRNLKIWWWCVVMFTIPAGLVCVAVSWLTCPHFTLEKILASCNGPSGSYLTIRDTTISIVLDILTDIMVVSFPIALLWKVRINMRQKVGLAFVLCLSLVMVIVSIVRIAGIMLASGNVDIVWLAFWVQQECSIAVIMVSCSAFRSFFIANTSSNPSPGYSPGSWKIRLLRRRRSPEQTDLESANRLPQIPGATLTGMRTVIRDMRISPIWPGGKESEGMTRLSESSKNAQAHSF